MEYAIAVTLGISVMWGIGLVRNIVIDLSQIGGKIGS